MASGCSCGSSAVPSANARERSCSTGCAKPKMSGLSGAASPNLREPRKLKGGKCTIRPSNRAGQKLQPRQQTPGLYSPRWPQALSENKIRKKHARTPVKPNVVRQEVEKSKLKCKNCGAFGHVARSARCPMRTWTRIVPCRVLGSSEEKENLNARKLQHPQRPALICNMDRERNPILRQQQKLLREVKPPMPPALPRPCQETAPRSCTESVEPCPFIRKRTMPMPVLIPKKRIL